MSNIVPLISSGVAGPLGLLHLPRLWLKASLEAAAIGLDREKFLGYIRDSKPSYSQLEAWIQQQPEAKLDKANIYKNNAAIMGYIHGDDVRKGILDAAGIADDDSVNPGAVDMNNIDDWTTFWSDELK